MPMEDDKSASRLRPPNARAPQLRKPMSSGTKLALIGGAFVAVTTGYSIISSTGTNSSNTYPTTADATDVVNTTVEQSGGGESLRPPYDLIDQAGARVRTAFGPDWSATVSGRQILFSDPSNRIACQSLVLPIAEYTSIMNQFADGVGQYADEAAHASGEKIIGATITTVSRESLPVKDGSTGPAANWEGAKVVLDYSGASHTTRNAIFVASSKTGEHGAMLTCSSPDSPETAQVMERAVRGYRLEPAT